MNQPDSCIYLKPYAKLCVGKYRDSVLDFHSNEIIVIPTHKIVTTKDNKNAICSRLSAVEYVEHFTLEKLLIDNIKCLSYMEPIPNQKSEHRIDKLFVSSLAIGSTIDRPLLFLLKERYSIKNIIVVAEDNLEDTHFHCFAKACDEAGIIHISILLNDILIKPDNLHLFNSVVISSSSPFLNECIKLCINEGVDYFIDESLRPLQSEMQLTCTYENYIRLKHSSHYTNQLYIKSKNEVTYTPLLGGPIEHYECNNDLIRAIDSLQEKSYSYTKKFSDKCNICEYRLVCNHPCVIKERNGKQIVYPFNCHYRLYEGDFFYVGDSHITLSHSATVGFITVNTNSNIIPSKLNSMVTSELKCIADFYGISSESLLLTYNYTPPCVRIVVTP